MCLPLMLAIVALGMGYEPVTIHLAGDSTMAEKKTNRRPETGWGEFLQRYFDPAAVRVENHAKGGRSTRTFIAEGLWQQLLDRVRVGDYVFIQFGHNDEVPSKVDRYTPPDQYRRNLIRFITEVRAAQAIPVLLTPVSRRKFGENGRVVDSHREYSSIVRGVAADQRVVLIDMDRISADSLARYGVEGSKHLFLHMRPGENPNFPDGIEDNTHFSAAGAALMAAIAAQGIRDHNLAIAKRLPSWLQRAESAKSESMLGSARIAKLERALRESWQRYIASSDSVRRTDAAALETEIRAGGGAALAPAPTGAGFFLTRAMTPAWFATREAGELADILMSYQAPNGGWSKRIDFVRSRQRGEGFTSAGNTLWRSTLDNGATTEQLRFLGARIKARSDVRHEAAFERGIEYLLVAQTPVGCWPQIFPLAGGYHDALTYNDDATINALEVLRDVARGDYGRFGGALRARAITAVERGIHCIVMTQVATDRQPSVWAAQHDPITLAPVKARTYEHASLSGRESAKVLDFLMEIERPAPAVIAAVHTGAAWFKANAIYGYTYAFKSDLTPQAGAGPLWARFYELVTNLPIFSDRDGVIRYSLIEIGEERRYNYGWYTDEPAATLRRYERWARKYPPSNGSEP